MGNLGERFRQAREAKGLSLRQVEEATRIRREFLQALEEERSAELPDDVYARGLVKNYATFLGLDPAEMVAAYRRIAATGVSLLPSPSAMLNEPLLSHIPRRRTGRWVGILFLVIALIIGGWIAYSRFYLGAAPWRLPLSQRGEAPMPTLPIPTQGIATPLPPTPTEAPSPTFTPLPTTAPTLTLTPSVTTTPRPTEMLSPTPASAQEGIIVEAIAEATTWIAVQVDGQPAFTGTLRPGQTTQWVAQTSLSMRIGNAGGLRLRVNGVEVPPLGASGQVVEVTYTPETLPHTP